MAGREMVMLASYNNKSQRQRGLVRPVGEMMDTETTPTPPWEADLQPGN